MKLKAFTMAEILLSLTIIGIVAAITLPSLTGNINERTWNTQRKALYARMSQAIALMPALNNFGKYSATGSGSDKVVTEDTAAEVFVASGLAKVYKINNICADDFKNCGIASKYTNLKGTATVAFPKSLYELNSFFERAKYGYNVGLPDERLIAENRNYDTKAVAFETQNGESLIAYYNPKCRTEYLSEAATTSVGKPFGFATSVMCVNFIYDLNGSKGPNTVGKDIGFITVFNSVDNIVVDPMPTTAPKQNGYAKSISGLQRLCTNQDPESRAPNIDELSAMFINRDLINLDEGYYFSVSTPGKVRHLTSGEKVDGIWMQDNVINGIRELYGVGETGGSVRCIKR